jgi:hypothetical protein
MLQDGSGGAAVGTMEYIHSQNGQTHTLYVDCRR